MFSTARAIAAEGARCGIVICRRCGVALLLDPDEKVNVLQVHEAWHDALPRKRRLNA
jgi:hypothetical protein